MSESDEIDIDATFDGKAWTADELAERLNWNIEHVRRVMIQLENSSLVKHVKDGRYNVYFTSKDYRKYLERNPKLRISEQLTRTKNRLR